MIPVVDVAMDTSEVGGGGEQPRTSSANSSGGLMAPPGGGLMAPPIMGKPGSRKTQSSLSVPTPGGVFPLANSQQIASAGSATGTVLKKAQFNILVDTF